MDVAHSRGARVSRSPARSPAYLSFVRQQPCWFCSSTEAVHAHHHGRKRGGGGMGIKTCDLQAVPLCARHHDEWHRTGKIAPYDLVTTPGELWEAVASTLRKAVLSGQFSGVETLAV